MNSVNCKRKFGRKIGRAFINFKCTLEPKIVDLTKHFAYQNTHSTHTHTFMYIRTYCTYTHTCGKEMQYNALVYFYTLLLLV